MVETRPHTAAHGASSPEEEEEDDDEEEEDDDEGEGGSSTSARTSRGAASRASPSTVIGCARFGSHRFVPGRSVTAWRSARPARPPPAAVTSKLPHWSAHSRPGAARGVASKFSDQLAGKGAGAGAAGGAPFCWPSVEVSV